MNRLPSKVKEDAVLISPPIGAGKDACDELYRSEPDTFMDEKKWSPVSEMFSAILKIIPEEIIQKIDAIANYDTQTAWEIGDLTNEVYTRAQAGSATQSYTYNDVCFFVSKMMNNSRSYSTVKGYAITARQFAQEVREAFSYRDVPFSHFAYAGQPIFSEINPHTGNPYWRDILDYSYFTSIGESRKVPETELRTKFGGKVPDPNKTGFKLGKHPNIVTMPVTQVGYVTEADQIEASQLPVDDLKKYVSNRLRLIVAELSGLSLHVVGRIPSFPSQQFSGAILLFTEVIRRMK